MPSHIPIPEADECSKAKGNCTEASSTARYQPVAIARARNPMVPVIVLKASRETVQQHPVMKRNHHHPEERSPMDQKDIKP